jgi:hypothetical protein
MAKERKYKSFWAFYPYYLTEHSNPTCRLLHFVGTSLAVTLLVSAFVFQQWILLAFILPVGYGFAWVGHFFIEKNRPATFTYPLWSFASDFVMAWHILTGQINQRLADAHRTIKA